MKYLLLLLFIVMPGIKAVAQNRIKIIIEDEETREALPGASAVINSLQIGAIASENGQVELINIPDGNQEITFSMVGYKATSYTYSFPLKSDSASIIYLVSQSEELEDVVVSATRSSRLISDIPTRIETISAGELSEKAVMQSANIRMILTESTGIQTQQTSAISGNTSIRIQGLDGKYTQLLKDGFPLYSGFSGGLSIMQIPPLDLKRAEVIKGSSSTLYGGGAIAGLINLVSKEPTDKNEFTTMVNLTSAKGLDLNTFYSHKYDKTGVTVFASRTSQVAYDPDADIFSDIPQNVIYNLNPKVFYYINPSSVVSLGFNSSIENRIGGDMNVINDEADNEHQYYQRNKSGRFSTQLKFEQKFENKTVLTFKNSVMYFLREITMPDYLFKARQVSGFSELSYLIPGERSEWIAGLDLRSDNFNETDPSFYLLRDYKQLTAGSFIQNNLKLSEKLIIESGLRAEYLKLQSPYYTDKSYIFLLPRLSLLYKFTPDITSRIGGGLGYKPQGLFAEETETRGFMNVMPVNTGKVKPEKSAGINFDVNYKTILFGKVSLSINQMFFYTRINDPVVPNHELFIADTIDYENVIGNLNSKGWETNVKFRYGDISVYFGYTFIDAERNFNGTRSGNPLTARNRLYFTPMLEKEKKIRIGYEVFYVSPQTLTTGEKVRDYWLMGISAEKFFRHFSLFVNFENILDSRQSRWQPMYTGSIQNPQFGEIWAPTDGFLVNGGIRLMF